MSINKALSTIGLAVASVGLVAGTTATPVQAAEVDRQPSSTSSSAGSVGFLPRIRIRCTPIFVDWDSDEVQWICEIVWD